MSKTPSSDSAASEPNGQPEGFHDLGGLLLAAYFVALIVVVVALLVVPVFL
jgi:hypothetical protein